MKILKYEQLKMASPSFGGQIAEARRHGRALVVLYLGNFKRLLKYLSYRDKVELCRMRFCFLLLRSSNQPPKFDREKSKPVLMHPHCEFSTRKVGDIRSKGGRLSL